MAAAKRKIVLRKYFPFFGIFIIFLFFTILITYPLLAGFTTRITGLGDELLVTWIMNWNIHALFTDPLHIFQTNIFFPYPNTLAYSDVFFTSSVIALIPYFIFKEPVVVFNANLMFSLFSLGFFTYLLVYYLTKNHFAGIISGALLSFSTFTLTKIAILQLLSIQWIPLSLLFFFRFVQKKKLKDFVLCMFFFLFQVYNSFLPGYFLLFCYACIIVCLLIQRKISFSLFLNRKVVITTILVLITIIPLALPYYRVSEEFHYVRDIRDTINFANRPEYTFYPSQKTRLRDMLMSTLYPQPGKLTYDGYLGAALIILTIALVIYRFLVIKKSLHPYFQAFSLISIGAFILSLGPAWQWGGHVIKHPFIIPLPYAICYYLVPGFKGIRNSGRWEMLTVFALCVLIGLGTAYFFTPKKKPFQIALTVLICFLTLIEYPFPLHTEAVRKKEDFPAIYKKMKALPQQAAIIELPLYNWNMTPYSVQEFMREYYGTLSFRKTVNGFSGFFPPEWENQALVLMKEFPDDKTISLLRDQGVSYLVIHTSEYNALEKDGFMGNTDNISWQKISTKLQNRHDVRFVRRVQNDYIYQLL